MNIKTNSSVNADAPSHARALFEDADLASRRAHARLARFFERERYARISR